MEQVARLSAQLFDAAQELHGLGPAERDLLICAALLHDIGFAVAERGHHKYSMHVILKADIPALTRDERLIVANVARYHRKALPKLDHPRFAELRPAGRKIVRALAALLRVADGLDRVHENAVAGLSLRLPTPNTAELTITGPGHLDEATAGALRKADLFEKTFGRRLQVRPEGEQL
jgi:exopolyphosphatase/guanosine-5'-triphosphate,3'-diphosphate pyrophosphatase